MSVQTLESIWRALDAVKDPEIPVVSVVDMGIVRDIAIQEDRTIVTITPTFSGCPALIVMQENIIEYLKQIGIKKVEVRVTLSPPWSTEWISEEARVQLKSFGLAPPPHHDGNFTIALLDAVECPYCQSTNTSLRNSFGPTLCRAIFYCNSCHQPFEQFKPL
jgi:ring-1,2-phenylacetyl-CoA epoxidase subunit PaaD